MNFGYFGVFWQITPPPPHIGVGWLKKGEGVVVGGMHTKGRQFHAWGSLRCPGSREFDFDMEVPGAII